MSAMLMPDDPPDLIDTLEGLRARVDHRPERPSPITRLEYEALSDGQRDAYDLARRQWVRSGLLVPTREAKQLIKATLEADEVFDPYERGAQPVILLDGIPTAGKTTALDVLVSRIEDAAARRFPEYREHGHCPIVSVTTPPNATSKALYGQIVRFFGVPVSPGMTEAALASLAMRLLLERRVRVLIIDEFHAMPLTGQRGAATFQAVKDIMNRGQVLTVLAGNSLRTSLTSPAASQVMARAEQVIAMEPHHNASAVTRQRWSLLVARLAEEMFLLDQDAKDVAEHADHLMSWCQPATIGNLRKLMYQAFMRLLQSKTDPTTPERLTQEDFDKAAVALGRARPVAAAITKRKSPARKQSVAS